MKTPVAFVLLSIVLSACSIDDAEMKSTYPELYRPNRYTTDEKQRSSVFDNFKSDGNASSGFSWTWRGGGNDESNGKDSMWSAALDAVSFMPLASADSAGGIIITDWYSPPKTPDQKFKLNVIVKGDDVSVTAFKQGKKGGQWIDQNVDPALSDGIKQAIKRRFKGGN